MLQNGETMIFGIGTDIIETERIQKAMQRKRFLDYVYTEAEQVLIAERVQKAAGNFAVKEAVVKAFGTGFSGICPKEIEVLRNEAGKPFVQCYGKAELFLKEHGITYIHVSISNIKEYAQAFVVLEK